jgi:hypothetical protein
MVKLKRDVGNKFPTKELDQGPALQIFVGPYGSTNEKARQGRLKFNLPDGLNMTD